MGVDAEEEGIEEKEEGAVVGGASSFGVELKVELANLFELFKNALLFSIDGVDSFPVFNAVLDSNGDADGGESR